MQQFQAFITPRSLQGVNTYQNENICTLFCWRWIQANNNNKYRVVTIEDVNFSYNVQIEPLIKPLDLSGTNGYSEELSKKTGFCWRWKTRDQDKYRVVTLEEGETFYNSAIPNSITPYSFCGQSDYHKNITEHFCWRWIKADDGKNYRVLTIE